MAVKGRTFTEQEIQRIVLLLAETDMTIPEIAERMHCSRSAVLSINRRWQVRLYNGARSSWERRTDEVP